MGVNERRRRGELLDVLGDQSVRQPGARPQFGGEREGKLALQVVEKRRQVSQGSLTHRSLFGSNNPKETPNHPGGFEKPQLRGICFLDATRFGGGLGNLYNDRAAGQEHSQEEPYIRALIRNLVSATHYCGRVRFQHRWVTNKLRRRYISVHKSADLLRGDSAI